MSLQFLPTLWLIGLSVVAGVAGQTAIKLGVKQSASVALANADPLAVVALILGSPWLLFGLLLYGLGALSWVVVLSRVDLSYAYPFLALNFVLVALVARLFLSESIPAARWMGIGFIGLGILIVARSGPIL